jgi:putative transposase
VSLSFVEALLRRMRRSGELAPLRRRPGPQAKVDDDACQRLARWLEDQPDLTLAELAARLQADGRPAVSTPTVCRALQRLGLRRKKRPYTPQNATLRRFVRHAINTGKTLPGMPPRG